MERHHLSNSSTCRLMKVESHANLNEIKPFLQSYFDAISCFVDPCHELVSSCSRALVESVLKAQCAWGWIRTGMGFE